MAPANAWSLATLVATAIAASLALWAQHRFAVVEHVAAFVGFAEALWGANARAIVTNEVAHLPTAVHPEELRTRLFEAMQEAVRCGAEVGKELCALRILAPQLGADADAILAIASTNEEKLPTVAEFDARKVPMDAATAAFEAKVRRLYPLNPLSLPWWE